MKRLLSGAVCALVLCSTIQLAAAQAGLDQLVPMSVGASSTLKPKKDQYAPWRAFDMDAVFQEEGGATFLTGWCEGKKGQGVGEYLEITGNGIRLNRISIAAGYWKSEKLFKKNNHPTRLTITVTDLGGQQSTHDLAVPDGMEMAVLELGSVVEASSIQIAFAEVKKGKLDDTCISNVELWLAEMTVKPFLEMPAAVEDLGALVADLNAALGSCDEAALKTRIKFPLAYKELPAPTDEKNAVKAKYKKAKDLAKACKKGKAPSPPEEIDFSNTFVEGPGKVMVFVGQGNEYGAQRWHLEYKLGPDGGPGGWLLRAIDY